MIYFSVIALVLILIALTHFHNFICRTLFEDGESVGLFFVTLIYLTIVLLLLKYIIIWGNLII